MSKTRNAAAPRNAPAPTRAQLLRTLIPDDLFEEPPDLGELIQEAEEAWRALLKLEAGPESLAFEDDRLLPLQDRLKAALPERLHRDFIRLCDAINEAEMVSSQAGFVSGFYYATRAAAARLR